MKTLHRASVFAFVLLANAHALAGTWEYPEWFLKLYPGIEATIQTAAPDEFIHSINTRSKVLSFGYNGVVFQQNRAVTKVNYFAISFMKGWQSIAPKLTPEAKARMDELNGWGGNTKNSILKEVLGFVAWNEEQPRVVEDVLLSTDEQAFQRDYLPGVPLKSVLGNPEGYNTKEIWRQVVQLQNHAEKILLKTGLSVDLISAGNLLVSGTPDKPIVTPIDFELLKPSQETFAYYQALGKSLPIAEVPELEWVTWPLMPDNILINHLWGLSYEQSLEYVEARYNLPRVEDQIKKLAEIPEYPIPFFTGAQNYENIRRARCNADLH